MNTRQALSTTLLAFALGCAVDGLPPPRTADGVPGSAGPALHDEAVRQLSAAKSSEYRHRVYVDEARGVFEYDCSGFVDYAIGNVAPDALTALPVAKGRHRASANTYVDLLRTITPGTQRGRWLHVADVAALQPGDVVAWTAVTTKPDRLGVVNTGHVMIVDESPHQRSTAEWVVPIIDSSGGHGGADHRKSPDVTGLGRGTIVLVVSDDGLVGYRWTQSPTSPLTVTSVMLGRIL
jgi:hypothetical protein